MSQEKISIIIPIHNSESYINRCIDSLVKQTYENIEIIIIENGSTDNSYELCSEWAKKDKRIKLLHLPSGNVSLARNTGLKNVTGHYYMFVDVDDYVDPTICEKLISSAIKNKSDMTFCRIANVHKSGKIVPIPESGLKDFMDNDHVECWFETDMRHGVWRILFLTSKFVDITFDEIVNIHEDHLYFFQAKMRCSSCSIVDEPLYFYNYNYDLPTYQAKKYYRPNSNLIYKHYSLGLKEFFEHYGRDNLARAYQYQTLMELETMIIFNEEKYRRKIKELLSEDFWKQIDNRKNYKQFLKLKKLNLKTKIGYILLRHHMFGTYKFLKHS